MVNKECEVLYQTIKSDFNKLYHSIEKLNDAQLNQPMYEKKWSICQTIHHINFSFSSTIGYINKKIQYPETIQTKNFISIIKSKMINTLLRTNIKFKGPQLITTNVLNHYAIVELNHSTSKNLDSLFELLNTFPRTLENKNVFKHPIAKYITLKQTLEFLHAHLLHHVRQIERYLNKKY